MPAFRAGLVATCVEIALLREWLDADQSRRIAGVWRPSAVCGNCEATAEREAGGDCCSWAGAPPHGKRQLVSRGTLAKALPCHPRLNPRELHASQGT